MTIYFLVSFDKLSHKLLDCNVHLKSQTLQEAVSFFPALGHLSLLKQTT